MMRRPSLEYHRLAAEHLRSADTWEMFVADVLRQHWLEQYAAMTPWVARVVETTLGSLTYLFDAAPRYPPFRWATTAWCDVGPRERTRGTTGHVAPVWLHPGTSHLVSARSRPRSLRRPRRWWRDGHQLLSAKGLNRGTSERGRMWRAMERHTTHPGTPLFVRPVHGDGTWVPELVDYGVFIERRLRGEQSENRD